MSMLLPIKDRLMVDYVLLNCMSWSDAFCRAYGKPIAADSATERKYHKRAEVRMSVPVVKEYYDEMRGKIMDYEKEQATWSREVATEKLRKLIEKAEDELYTQEQKITMARLHAVVDSSKELNELWGLKEQNININGEAKVVFTDNGEDLLD